MLYDPKWEPKPTPTGDVLALGTLIAWLETKDPAETYCFNDCGGGCLFSQYLLARPGYTHHTERLAALDGCLRDEDQFTTWFNLHRRYTSIAVEAPSTFGAALHRAHCMAEHTHKVAA